MLHTVKEVFNHFFKSNTFQKGAALAYYAVFSILPIIIIIVSILGLFFGEQAVSGDIYSQLNETLGVKASLQIQLIIKNHHQNHDSLLTSIIGFCTLGLSASGMFTQIHSSFNNLWNIMSKPKNSLINYATKHVTSFIILILLFLIIFISTLISSFLSTLDYGISIVVLEHIISWILLSLSFTLMYNYLGDAIIHWKAVIMGGMITGLLFMIGKIGISMYIGHSHITSTFGSASVLALLMLWVYYTSQIIFLGASCVYIISKKIGHPIKPNDDAVIVEHVEK